MLLNNETLKEFTINKLRYDSLQLVGREKEIQLLQSVVDRAISKRSSSSSKEMVFIGGYSGVGKSALADTLSDYVAAMEDGIFLRGKFGMNNYEEPYSAIADAFNGFFAQIKAVPIQEGEEEFKSNGTFADLKELLVEELGSELHLLAHLIPSLETIGPSSTRMSLLQSHSDDAGHERWKYAFRVLTRVLSSYFSPMVFLLEDLQWIDISSLEIIEHLITDNGNPNPLVVVCNYRSNEVDVKHILFGKREELIGKQDTFNFKLTDIELSSLGVDGVNMVMMAMLAMDDPDKTRRLADICFKRTQGNPYFVIEYMALLEEEKLISFNFGLMSWTWDESKIESLTMSTANVVDLLQSRMEKLPEDCQLLLQYAACLGSSFKTSIVELVWREHSSSNLTSEADGLASLLRILEESHYIEKCGVDTYCWVHDKVQEAALSMGKASSPTFQFEIGSLLFHSLSETELDAALFDVVNLINRGNVPRRPEYAELAARKARKMSAFHSAAIFANNSIKLLPNDKCSNHRALALACYTIGAEMSYAIGDTEKMDLYTDAVLSQEMCSTIDKLPLYMAKATKLSTTDSKHKETIVLCLDVLKTLGCKLDCSSTVMPLCVTVNLMKTLRMVKKRTRESYIELDQMTDEKEKAIMHLLAKIAYCSYNTNDIFINILVTCEMVQRTLKYGIAQDSGHAFGGLAIITMAFNRDFALATQIGETALFLQSMTNSTYTEAITNYITHSHILPWTKPLSSCQSQLSKTYTIAMKAGNTEFATWAISVAHISIPFQTGKNLDSILAKCPGCLAQIEELKQHDQLQFVQLYRDAILILCGHLDQNILIPNNDESLELSSSIRDVGDIVGSPAYNAVKKFVHLSLSIFFGKFKEAASIAMQSGDQFLKTMPGHHLGMMETFYRALAMYAMARTTKKRKYKIRAKRIHKTVKGWVQNGNPNVQQYCCLLNAEAAALENKRKAAEAFYKYAIVLAARSGFSNDAALINERYAGYMREVGDEDEARYRIEEAIRFYRDWGAEAKVQLLSRTILS